MKKLHVFWFFLFVVGSLFGGCQCGSTFRIGDGKILKTDLPGVRTPLLVLKGVKLDVPREKSFLLFNDGKLPLTISDFQFVGADKLLFSLLQPPKLPLILQPGKEKGIRLKVRVLLKQFGSFRTVLQIQAPGAFNVDKKGFYSISISSELEKKGRFGSIQVSCSDVLDFGQIRIGTKKRLHCSLANFGSRPAAVRSFHYRKIAGADKAFSWVFPLRFPIVLPANATKTIKVYIDYHPVGQTLGKDEGVFLLELTSTSVKPRILVKGRRKLGSAISIVPAYPSCSGHSKCQRIDPRLKCRIDLKRGGRYCLQSSGERPFLRFPKTVVGKVTEGLIFIRSVGTDPLIIKSIHFQDQKLHPFELKLPFFPIKIVPGGQVAIKVRYRRSRVGLEEALVQVKSDASADEDAYIYLQSEARGCDLEVQPKLLQFRGKEVKQVTVQNEGDLACVLKKASLRLGTLGKVFSWSKVPVFPVILKPGASHSFLLEFKPQLGQPVSRDQLEFSTNDPLQVLHSVNLEGFGKSDGRACVLEAKPRGLDFQTLGVNQLYRKSFFLRNTGWGICDIKAIKIFHTKPSGSDAFRLLSSLRFPSKLKHGEALALGVGFLPSKIGEYKARLVISSNDQAKPQMAVDLFGLAAEACLSILPRKLDFGKLTLPCQAQEIEVKIFHLSHPKCPDFIEIQAPSCSNSNCRPKNAKGEFVLLGSKFFPHKIEKGKKLLFSVEYRPSNLGVDQILIELKTSLKGRAPIQLDVIGEGVSQPERREIFYQPKVPKVDVLFVLDNSCSMEAEHTAMRKSLPKFFRWTQKQKIDYHIGVTTTDVSNRYYPAGCLQGPKKIISSTIKEPLLYLNASIHVGTHGSGTEKGLEAAAKALSAPTLNDPKCNRGFYRKDAMLSIVFVSNDSDQSEKSADYYLNFFQSLKGREAPALVRGFAIAGPPPYGCSNGEYSAGAAVRYWDVSKRLRGTQHSICKSNWDKMLSETGQRSFAPRRIFLLREQVNPKDVTVRVNGRVVPQDKKEGWSFDLQINAVIFSLSNVPPPGAKIEVIYRTRCNN